MVTLLVRVKQSSVTVRVYVPAGRLLTEAVVPTTVFAAFFQEYDTVPTLPLTIPAVTDPVLAPKQVASVLLEAARESAAAG